MTLFGEAYKQVLQIDYLIWVPSKSMGGKYLLQVKKSINTASSNVYIYITGGMRYLFSHSLTLQ